MICAAFGIKTTRCDVIDRQTDRWTAFQLYIHDDNDDDDDINTRGEMNLNFKYSNIFFN